MDRIRLSNFPENFVYEYTQRTPGRIRCSTSKDLRNGIDFAVQTFLNPTEQQVVNSRYKERKIYKHIADELNVSKGYPYQILKGALEKLRQEPMRYYIEYGLEGARQILDKNK